MQSMNLHIEGYSICECNPNYASMSYNVVQSSNEYSGKKGDRLASNYGVFVVVTLSFLF